MKYDLVLKDGRFVLQGKIHVGDVAVADGKIARIGKKLSGDESVDLRGRFVLPGLIDSHVHFREPGASQKEDWTTGSYAAVAGGVSTVLDMPNNSPATVSAKRLEAKRKCAAKSVCDYGFHFGATEDNLAEIRKVRRIASVKFYLGSTTGDLLMVNHAILFNELKALARRGVVATVHAEDEALVRHYTKETLESGRDDAAAYSDARPASAALRSVNQMIFLSKMSGAHVHVCHISTKKEVETLRQNKRVGNVTVEVCPHHLFLTKKDLCRLGTYGKMNPPLRSEGDRRALWNALCSGLIDTVATDHAPHTRAEKNKGFFDAPAGVPGIETMLPLLLDQVNRKRISLHDVARLTCENPARIFGLKGKGRIRKGFDADFSVLDMKKRAPVSEETLYTKCGWTPFVGRVLKGWPQRTFVRGKLVFEDGDVYRNKGEEVRYENV